MSRFSRHTEVASLELLAPRLVLMLSVLALVLFGLVMVYSTSSVNAISEGGVGYKYIIRQLAYVALGVILALVVYRGIPYYAWRYKPLWIAWGASMVLLALVPLIGTEIYGAKRWLGIGEVLTIQPSEFVKISLLLFTAKVIDSMRAGDVERRAAAIQIVLCVVLPALFLYKTQSDLGTTAIIAVGVVAVLWLGDIPLKIVFAILAAGVAMVVFSIVGTDYRSGRMVFLDPWNDGADGYGDGYNIIRSYYAIAEGGVLGAGLGNSHEKYQYLFASESDFIYAIIAEELGLIGALAIIALFLVFLVSGLRIAAGAPDDLGRMIAGGCTIMIVFQAFLNIGCVIGVFPTTGKPLPFVSMGGSSMMSSMIMVGLILSVAKGAGETSVYERRREDLRVIRAHEPYASAAPAQRGQSFRPQAYDPRVRAPYASPSQAPSARPYSTKQRDAYARSTYRSVPRR